MKSVPSASNRLNSERLFVFKYRSSNAKGYRGCIQRHSQEQHLSASLPLTQNINLSVYLLVGQLRVYVVSTHVKIFIFPSVPVNFQTRPTEMTFIFSSLKSILNSFYFCKLFPGVLLSLQMGTFEAQLIQTAHQPLTARCEPKCFCFNVRDRLGNLPL